MTRRASESVAFIRDRGWREGIAVCGRDALFRIGYMPAADIAELAARCEAAVLEQMEQDKSWRASEWRGVR